MKFVDEISFHVASGKGGDGQISFRREKFVPRGGPDGGDGGRGGDLVFEATRQRNTLVDFRFNKTYRAPSGQKGMSKNMYGRKGDDLVLLVPVGTSVYDDATNELLADLNDEGDSWRLVGGDGGKGNSRFKSSRQRTPLKATAGFPGIEMKVRLELKLIADIGLLGFPNAGKSTLISRMSAATPRVADYPFTTLVPSLGVVEMDPGSSFVMADIPGLIEGASEGVGLGHRFLKHVERCAALAHLVSANPLEELDPVARHDAINAELERYDPALAERPQVVLLTQVDLVDEETAAKLVSDLAEAAGAPVLAISSVDGTGLAKSKGRLWEEVQRSRETERQNVDAS